jgi:hypothetical protein
MWLRVNLVWTDISEERIASIFRVEKSASEEPEWAGRCKMRKACGLDDIPNECLRHLPRIPLVYLRYLFNHCLRLPHFPKPWKVIRLPKPGKDPKFPQNLRPISLLSVTGKQFEKVILKTVQWHIEERSLLNANQFGFRARHSTTLQCMRPTDHVILNSNYNTSTAAVFLDIEIASGTTCGTLACYINYPN